MDLSSGVKNKKDYVGISHGFAGFRNTDRFCFVRRVAETCSINEFYGDAIEGYALSDQVAGGARGGRNDGAIALNQSIKKGGFAGVWAANDCQGEAFADYAAVGKCLF